MNDKPGSASRSAASVSGVGAPLAGAFGAPPGSGVGPASGPAPGSPATGFTLKTFL